MSQPPQHSKEPLWVDKSVAERYANAEHATAPFAKLLASKANFAAAKDMHVLDLATGTGAAVAQVYAAIPAENWASVSVVGTDVSAPMLEYLAKRAEKEGWRGLSTATVDGSDLASLSNHSFTHVLCTFGIFLFPSALMGAYELLQPAGFVGVTTWRGLAWTSLLERCMALMPDHPYTPSAAEVKAKLYAGRAWDEPAYVAEELRAAGFTGVETDVRTIVARVGTPAMFVDSMQFPLKMIIASFWPEERRERYVEEVNAIMLREVEGQVNDEGVVEMEFEGLCAWGWKA